MQVLVGRDYGAGDGIDLRRQAFRGLADSELNVAAGEPEVGQLAVAHPEQLGLSGTQLEVGLDPSHETAVLAADPEQGVAERIGDEFGAGLARAQFDHVAVGEGKAGLHVVFPPRRRSFAGQIFKHLNRLGHHRHLLQLCDAVRDAASH